MTTTLSYAGPNCMHFLISMGLNITRNLS